MSKLSEKSYKTLEFYTILHELSELCVSRKAKEQARDLRPMHDVEDVRLALQQTDDAKKMMTTLVRYHYLLLFQAKEYKRF